jgi:hypothetical protein
MGRARSLVDASSEWFGEAAEVEVLTLLQLFVNAKRLHIESTRLGSGLEEHAYKALFSS